MVSRRVVTISLLVAMLSAASSVRAQAQEAQEAQEAQDAGTAGSPDAAAEGTPAAGAHGGEAEPEVVQDETPPAGDPDAAEARRLFERGIEYAREERWGEALEYFRRSRAVMDRPSTAFNAAVALLRLGRPSEALEALNDYLRTAGESEEERRAEARRLLELALSSIGQVTLTLDPPHADVRVDGDLVAGDEAVRTFSVDPGTHTVRVSAEGYEPQTFELSVLDGEQVARTVALEADTTPSGPARVTITSTVASARIRVDGDEVGMGTWTGELEPGRHRVEVVADDHETFRRTVDLEPAERLNVQASLQPVREPSFFERPIVWIVAGVIVVGAGVGIGIALASGTEDPYPGTTGVVLQGLRF